MQMMRHNEYWFTKHALLSFGLLLSMSLTAASYRTASRGVEHYLTASLGGGLSLSPTTTDHISHPVGATASFGLSYELRYQRLLFGFGAGAEGLLTRDELSAFRDTYDRVTRDGDEVKYSYCYTLFGEKRRSLLLSVPIYFGAQLGRHTYVLAGASMQARLLGDYQTKASMYSEAEYSMLPGAISQNLPSFGYGIYPEKEYSYTAAQAGLPRLAVSPMVEAGVRLPIKRRLDCRIGGFVQYRLWLTKPSTEALIDLSAVDLSPFTQNQANLAEHIRYASMETLPDVASTVWNNLLIGVRVTLRLNVTVPHKSCMCSE